VPTPCTSLLFTGKERSNPLRPAPRLPCLLVPSSQVPPEKRDDFEDTWREAAFKTIKEDGNRIYS
jgi:hypothetical protein